MRYVIVGASAAGIFAAETIRRQSPGGEIIMLASQIQPPYSRCLTSYYVGGQMKEDLLVLRPKVFASQLAMDLRLGVRVVSIDPDRCCLTLEDGFELEYDRLLVATGASPQWPQIPGLKGEGVFTLRHWEDAKALRQQVKPGGKAVVLGGGLVGLKTAAALVKQQMEVTVVVGSAHILSRNLEPEAAAILQDHLDARGMNFILETEALEIGRDASGRLNKVVLSSGEELRADLLVVAKGVKPNTGLLARAGAEIKEGVVVDRFLSTGLPGVYAAGDVAAPPHWLTGEPAVFAIWPNATRQGEVAGANMAGVATEYEGTMPMNSLEFFGLTAISAGIVNREEGDKVLVSRRGVNYRRLIFRKGRLVGYTLVGDVAKAGRLTALLKSGQSPENVMLTVPLCDWGFRCESDCGRGRIPGV